MLAIFCFDAHASFIIKMKIPSKIAGRSGIFRLSSFRLLKIQWKICIKIYFENMC